MACHRDSTIKTPPTTRKRKAAEAASADNPSSSSSSSSGAATGTSRSKAKVHKGEHKQTTTGTPSASDSEAAGDPGAGIGKESQRETTDLVTPATTTRTGSVSMDSEDEFMSDVSSQGGFLDTQGSEDESIGEGECLVSLSTLLGVFDVGLRNSRLWGYRGRILAG